MANVTDTSSADRPIAVVGAGLAGLTAARILADAGRSVLLVERGRSVGGRLATRTMGRSVLDHGAQFFTVRSAEFEAVVEDWLADGAVAEWCRGFDEEDGYPRYRGEGGMAALAQYLAERAAQAGVELVTGVTTTSVIPGADGWTLTHDHWQREPDEVGAVILTPPAPESVELLRAGGAGPIPPDILGLRYHSVLALLATLTDEAPAPRLPACGGTQRPDDEWFSFVADNRAKGISPGRSMTFHTAHAKSAELWAADDRTLLRTLAGPAAQLVGLSPSDFAATQLRRWRHTGPLEPLRERYVEIQRAGNHPLLLCGDAFGGPKIEGAFLSGRAAARALLS